QGLVVDPEGVHLAEPELAALGEEALGPLERLVDLLVLVSGRGAVDDDGRLLEGLAGLVVDLVAARLEMGDLVRVGGELGASAQEMLDLRLLGRHRGALVERDLVDAELLLEVGEEADEGLPDSSRPDDVNGLLHDGLLPAAL